jgi:hypothetical protein
MSSDSPISSAPSIQIRREYLKHEASIRSVGTLYYVGAILAAVMVLMNVLNDRPIAVKIGMSILFVGLIFLYVKVGSWLNALDKRAKVPATILACIGLLAIPVGTLINGYILYLLLSKKGTVVFSEDYKKVIADTPEIKYKISLLIWILLGIVLVGLAAAMLIPLLERHRA